MTESPCGATDPSFGPRHGQRLTLMTEEGEFELAKSSADLSPLKTKFAGGISRKVVENMKMTGLLLIFKRKCKCGLKETAALSLSSFSALKNC